PEQFTRVLHLSLRPQVIPTVSQALEGAQHLLPSPQTNSVVSSQLRSSICPQPLLSGPHVPSGYTNGVQQPWSVQTWCGAQEQSLRSGVQSTRMPQEKCMPDEWPISSQV